MLLKKTMIILSQTKKNNDNMRQIWLVLGCIVAYWLFISLNDIVWSKNNKFQKVLVMIIDGKIIVFLRYWDNYIRFYTINVIHVIQVVIKKID